MKKMVAAKKYRKTAGVKQRHKGSVANALAAYRAPARRGAALHQTQQQTLRTRATSRRGVNLIDHLRRVGDIDSINVADWARL